MKNFLKYISLELYIVLSLFIFGYITKFHEIIYILNKDIGIVIAAFGILWFVTGFFRVVKIDNWGYFFLSLVCSFGTILIGISLSLWGIGPALAILPIYFILILSPISKYLDHSIPYLKIIIISFLIGLFLITLYGFTNSKYLKGTKQFDRTEDIENKKIETAKKNKNSTWIIICEKCNLHWGTKETDTIGNKFNGTYEEALKYGKEQSLQFNIENKGNIMIFDSTILPTLYEQSKYSID